MTTSLLLLVAAAAIILTLVAPAVFLRHNLTLPLLGSSNVPDRDTDRVNAELRAITSIRETTSPPEPPKSTPEHPKQPQNAAPEQNGLSYRTHKGASPRASDGARPWAPGRRSEPRGQPAGG
ncbi:hypothetical protein, partial [Nocardia sp. NPDC051570]|uniref:hypothetical protein n=1 Tax=Nocardia sp. NPDC051570 TaxID=3364324 RepID=UPI00378DEF8F